MYDKYCSQGETFLDHLSNFNRRKVQINNQIIFIFTAIVKQARNLDFLTDRQMDMAISTRLMMLIKNIYTLLGLARLLLLVSCFFGWHKVIITFYAMSSGYEY